jgi:hypothetical protein
MRQCVLENQSRASDIIADFNDSCQLFVGRPALRRAWLRTCRTADKSTGILCCRYNPAEKCVRRLCADSFPACTDDLNEK